MKNKFWTIIFSLTLIASFSLVSGCQKAADKSVETKDKATEPTKIVETKDKALETTAGYSKLAIPSGEDLRAYVFEQMPYKKWVLWPGKGKLMKGTEPHGAFITVYVNDKALESIKQANGMIDTSIVLKENYNADKQLTSVTAMMKVKGYNPAGGDWLWVRFGPDSKVTDEGKVVMCLGCHTVAKANDYIYTGKVTAEGTSANSVPGYSKPAPGDAAPGKK